MMNELSADDVEREHLEAMGVELGSLFHALYNELASLHDKWREYCELFGASPARIDVLNATAPRFFAFIDEALKESTLLHISRITDRPEIGRSSNLTILRLPALIEDPVFRSEVDELVATAVRTSQFARDWRNRHIAHRDLSLALDPSSRALSEASRLSVNQSLACLDAVLCRIHEHYIGDPLSLEVPGGPGDGLDLLRVLQDGLYANTMREERFNLGIPSPEDLNRPLRV